MLVYAPSGPSLPSPAPFTACEQLFTRYPEAVALHSPEGGGARSMVLASMADDKARFFILTKRNDSLFSISTWNPRERAIQEVIPGEPVREDFARVITDGVPVPRDRTVLGWVTNRAVTAILTVHGGYPTGADAAARVPEIQVMPMAGTIVLDWPPFTSNPLADGRFWDYVDRGDIVDLACLLAKCPGQAFLADCPSGQGYARAACVVVTANLVAEEYWLPAGVYADQWMLREGIPAPRAGQLLALPGTVDLAAI